MYDKLSRLFSSQVAVAEAQTFRSYAAAESAAGVTYDQAILAKLVVAKTLVKSSELSQQGPSAVSPSEILLQYVLSLGAGRIFDYGGAAGILYFLSKALSPKVEIRDWAVFETLGMCRASQGLGDGVLRFSESFEDCFKSQWDLGLFSSSIQYAPDAIGILKNLGDQKPAKRLLFTRSAFSVDPRGALYTVQTSRLKDNGPGPMPEGFIDQEIKYPVSIIQLEEFINALSKGYRLALQMPDQGGRHEFGDWKTVGGSYLFEKIQ